MGKRFFLGAMPLFLLFILTACGTNENNEETANDNKTEEAGTEVTNEDVDQTNNNTEEDITDNSDLTNNTTPTEIPEGMKEAENSKFKVGDEVTINAEHEDGMKGSTGRVTGAFDTIVYSVSYNPTHGDFREENHKWVVHEEIQGLDEEMLVQGAEIILETNQEEGMLGAEGEIDTAEKTIVYMVEYLSENGTSYQKWFKESELSAK